MKEIILKVGNDNGNSEHDLIINGKMITQPNVYSKIRKLPNFDEVNKEYALEKIEDNLIATLLDPSGIFYVGNYSLQSGQRVKTLEVGVDNNKIDSDVVFVNTLVELAAQGVKEFLNQNNNNFQAIGNKDVLPIKVDMTTSLPVSYYSKENAEKFSNKFLETPHVVAIHIGNVTINTQVEFEFVKTIPEGVTAAFALKENNKYFTEHNKKYEDNFKKEFFEDAKILHVAIGEGTTEFPITRGIEFNPQFIKGTNNGMGHAIDKALEEFKAEYGLAKFSRQDYSKVLKDKKDKYHDTAMEIVEPYIEDEADEILHHIKQEIQKANNDIDAVVVYGGGSILMKDLLEDKLRAFCSRAEIKVIYLPAKYSTIIETEGLYNFTNNKIFETLKEKYLKTKEE